MPTNDASTAANPTDKQRHAGHKGQTNSSEWSYGAKSHQRLRRSRSADTQQRTEYKDER